MAENSSLVSNKSHALGLDRHNNMATSEDFSSYFVLEVYSNVCVIIFIFIFICKRIRIWCIVCVFTYYLKFWNSYTKEY